MKAGHFRQYIFTNIPQTHNMSTSTTNTTSLSPFQFDHFPFHNFGFSDYDDVTNEVHRLFNRFMPEMQVGDFKNDSYSYETTSSYSRDKNGYVKNSIRKRYKDPSGRDKFIEKKSIGDVRNPNQVSMTTCTDTDDPAEHTAIQDDEYENRKKELENEEMELALLQKEINKKRRDVYERRLQLARH